MILTLVLLPQNSIVDKPVMARNQFHTLKPSIMKTKAKSITVIKLINELFFL